MLVKRKGKGFNNQKKKSQIKLNEAKRLARLSKE